MLFRSTHNPWPWVLLDPKSASTSELAKDRFSSILDTITRGSQTLIASCEQSLKEIGDDPKYLELYQNSIRDYKAQYGVEPLMPLSSALASIVNVDAAEALSFFPQHSLGERNFKWMYGTRGLIQNMTAQVTAESTPGWTQTVESFNMMVDTRLQVDRAHTDGFLKSVVKGLRWLFDLKHLKGVTTPHVTNSCVNTQFAGSAPGVYVQTHFSEGSFVRGNLVDTGATQLTNKSPVSLTFTKNDLRHVQPVFAVRNPFTRVIALTESSNKDDQLKTLVDYVSGDADGKRNNSLAVQNIIDLNIIPINVHALMREVPLANLYNYAYTYDRMIIELYYGLQNTEAMNMIRELCSGGTSASTLSKITSPKDMMVALLMNPYLNVRSVGEEKHLDIDSRSYAEYVQGMLLGATGDEMLGRPKFLSDQIYGKAVFGELYGSHNDVSSLGPGVRYSRKLTRTGLEPALAAMLIDITTLSDARDNANGTFGTINGNEDEKLAFATALAKIILDDQTATLPQLVSRISSLGATLTAVETSGNADTRTRFVYSSAILLKVVGTVFLWAANRVAKHPGTDTAAVAARATIANQMKTLVDLVKKVSNEMNAANPPAATGRLALTADFLSGLSREQLTPAEHLKKTFESVTGAPASLFLLRGGGGFIVNYLITQKKTIALLTASLTTNTGNDPAVLASSGLYTNTVPGDTLALHYLDDGQMKSAGVPADLAVNGALRFDTVLIRNLIFVVNLYRSIRLKLQRDLVYSRDIVTRSAPITRTQLTEFSGNATWAPRGKFTEETNNRYK